MFYPQIDYRSHPAFRNIEAKTCYDDAEVNQRIAQIDAAIEAFEHDKRPDAILPDEFNRGPGIYLSDLEDYLRRTSRSPRMSDWFSRAFVTTRHELVEEAHVANWRIEGISGETDGTTARRVTKALDHDGVYICSLEPDTLVKLRAICAPHMQGLREKAKSGGTERVVHTFERYSKVGMVLDQFFRRQGILDGLKGYVGSNVSFAGFSLEYSYAGQKWWRGLYSDVGLPESKTTYMHYDYGGRDPKAIIALSDIGEENGPTGFVKGSHKVERSKFLHTMIKSLDYAFQPDPTLPYKTVYYRDRFAKAEYRREFLEQPTAFHGCSHFGEDILDDTPLSRDLLSKEVKLTRNQGNCIVFDGNYGIHRGGLVRSGERFVFQIIFSIAPPLSLSQWVIRRSRGLAVRMLGKGN
ncbi:MAG TPA: phytanoyl-CoA dioxygenase family protein [Pseudolabrys sp.]|nr:phytanoyl-CoA dioxygenase family protein [Pseudolabrys sp.]